MADSIKEMVGKGADVAEAGVQRVSNSMSLVSMRIKYIPSF